MSLRCTKALWLVAAALAAHCVSGASRAGLHTSDFLSSKTNYWPQATGESEAMPPQCRLVHVNHIGRHGTRHATKLKNANRLARVLRQAAAEGALEPAGQRALVWVNAYAEEEMAHLGELTDTGRAEHADTAGRLWARHREELSEAVLAGRPMVLESTDKPRTKGSREAFAQGLMAAARKDLPNTRLYAADVGEVSSAPSAPPLQLVTAPGCPAQGQDHMPFAKLRFFDACPAYTEYRRSKPWKPLISMYTANATKETSHEMALLRQLFRPSFLSRWLRTSTGSGSSGGSSPPTVAPECAAPGLVIPTLKPAVAATHKHVGELLNSVAAQAEAEGEGDGEAEAEAEAEEGVEARDWITDEHDRRKLSSKKRGLKAQKLARKASRAMLKLAKMADKGGSGKGSEEGPQDVVSDIYSICQIEASALSREDRFCSLFEGQHLDLMAKYELLYDLGDYYKQGAGDPLAPASSCVLLEDFLAAGDAAAAGHGKTGPMAHFRFAHSETVMPILSILGLYQDGHAAEEGSDTGHGPDLQAYYTNELAKGTSVLLNATYTRFQARYGPLNGSDATVTATPTATPQGRPSTQVRLSLKHPWSGARLVPMAANVQWLLYDCGDDAAAGMAGLWVKMLHNEREIEFPPCSEGADAAEAGAQRPAGLRYPCPWDTVKEYYRSSVYEKHGLTTCDAGDWERLCGGIDYSSCDT